MQENLGRDDLIEELYWDTSIYANETINFQIWPSAIVEAGSFWNYQSKLTPDSKEFVMIINTQHKVSPASYPDVSLLMKMCAQRKAGRKQRARLLADLVFKMAARVMADEYAIFKISPALFVLRILSKS